MNAIAPQLPPNYRLIIIERNEFVQHSSFVVRALVAPGTCRRLLLRLRPLFCDIFDSGWPPRSSPTGPIPCLGLGRLAVGARPARPAPC